MSSCLSLDLTALSALRPRYAAVRVTRRRTLALILVGLTQGGSVPLRHIVGHWPGSPPGRGAQPLLARASATGRVRLLMDCTQVGKPHRVWTVSLAFRRRALPLAWSVHRGAKGHVSYRAQPALLAPVQAWLSPEAGVRLRGDAGFRSVPLMRWLQAHGWHWVLRQPGHTRVQPAGGVWIALQQRALHRGQTREIGGVRCTQRPAPGPFGLTLHWGPGAKEPWCLLSDTGPGALGVPGRRYRTRMWTEEMYGDMKRHGFDLEATRRGHPHRIARLLFAVCLATVWLLSLGSWVVQCGRRFLLDRKRRRDQSYFRLGGDGVCRCVCLADPVPFRLLPYFR